MFLPSHNICSDFPWWRHDMEHSQYYWSQVDSPHKDPIMWSADSFSLCKMFKWWSSCRWRQTSLRSCNVIGLHKSVEGWHYIRTLQLKLVLLNRLITHFELWVLMCDSRHHTKKTVTIAPILTVISNFSKFSRSWWCYVDPNVCVIWYIEEHINLELETKLVQSHM